MTYLNITLLACLVVVGGSAAATAQNSSSPPQLPSVSAQPSAIPELPVPSGQFGIGRIGYEWIDPSRSEIHAIDPKVHRDLMVYFWYPSAKNEVGKRGVYLPGAQQMNADSQIQSTMKEEFEAAWPSIASGATTSHSIDKAPVAKAPAQFPLVIFSHGNGGTSFEYTSLIENLVSHGYVVASIEHTYWATAVTFPDGRVVPAYRESPVAGLTSQQRFQRMMTGAGLQMNTGAADLIFVLSQLSRLNNREETHFLLGGRLDLNRVAAMGHSSGGADAALACQRNQQFKACLSLEGQLPPIAAFPGNPDSLTFTQPVLLLEVDHSGQRRGFDDAQNEQYLKKKQEQLNSCPAGSYDVVLKSPSLFHSSFSDIPLLIANGRATEMNQALSNLGLTQSYVLAFLDKYLKGASEPLLDGETNHPEAIVQRFGR